MGYHAKMINAVLVFNNNGQPRLTKFYTQLDTAVQQRLLSEIFTLVAARPNSACNFFAAATASRPFYLQQQHCRAERCAVPCHLPTLCHAVLHHDLHLDRITTCSARPHSSVCRGAG